MEFFPFLWTLSPLPGISELYELEGVSWEAQVHGLCHSCLSATLEGTVWA